MDIGKIPPHDVEAEQAVIGSMLTDKGGREHGCRQRSR